MLSVNFQKFYLFGVFWTERHYDQHNIIVDMQVKPTTFEVSSERIQVCYIRVLSDFTKNLTKNAM